MKKEVVFGNFLFCFVSTWYMVRSADRILLYIACSLLYQSLFPYLYLHKSSATWAGLSRRCGKEAAYMAHLFCRFFYFQNDGALQFGLDTF